MNTATSAIDSVLVPLLKKFPDAGSRTIATIAYKAHPEMWPSAEHCRQGVLYRRGLKGKGDHKKAEHGYGEFFRDKSESGAVFDTLPEPTSVFDAPWRHKSIEGVRRVLVLSDVHIPYHDNTALDIAIRAGKKFAPDCILLNGDTADFYSVSDWERDPRKRSLKDEIPAVRNLLCYLRAQFPKARIVWKDGNHEERWWRYLKVKAPELFGMPEFSLNALLWMEQLRVEYVGEMRPLRFGKLFILHGHEYRFPIANPVNPARGLFQRAKTLAACGHFHQSSQHSERDLSEKVVSTWSLGCLCDLHPGYRPINNWNHGFGLLQIDKGGVFELENKRIIEGKVY